MRQREGKDYRHRDNKGVAYWVAPSQYIKVKEITDMKRRIVSALIGVATISLVGHGNMITGETVKASKAVSGAISNTHLNMINLDTVTGYNGTASGLQLYTADGIGYYLEAENIQSGRTQLYYTLTQKDFDALTPILENRNGKIIIEVSNGTVSDSEGNGTDDCGYYRHYDSEKFSPGDYVQSVFVYNTDTNSTDDILYRVDTLIE